MDGLAQECVYYNFSTADANKKWKCVEYAQHLLTQEGYYSGATDGYFGPVTKAAVIKHQQNYTYMGDTKLAVDGWLGPKTWRSMCSVAYEAKRYNTAWAPRWAFDYVGCWQLKLNTPDAPPAKKLSPSTGGDGGTTVTGWTKPVASGYITQGYRTAVTGYSVPGCPYSRSHCAADLATGGVSKPVYAVAAGTVTKAQFKCGYATTGNCLVIQHADNTKTVYNHVAPSVWAGAKVSAGQKIGQLDSSGVWKGWHLHFMTVNSSGTVVDPVGFMKARGVTLP